MTLDQLFKIKAYGISNNYFRREWKLKNMASIDSRLHTHVRNSDVKFRVLQAAQSQRNRAVS